MESGSSSDIDPYERSFLKNANVMISHSSTLGAQKNWAPKSFSNRENDWV